MQCISVYITFDNLWITSRLLLFYCDYLKKRDKTYIKLIITILKFQPRSVIVIVIIKMQREIIAHYYMQMLARAQFRARNNLETSWHIHHLSDESGDKKKERTHTRYPVSVV